MANDTPPPPPTQLQLALAKMTEYLKTSPTLKTWLSDETELETLFSKLRQQAKDWEAAVQYEGFNVLKVLGTAKKTYDEWVVRVAEAEEKLHTVIFPKELLGTAEDWPFDLRTSFAETVNFLLFIFVNRGCTWVKITAKISKPTSEFLELAKVALGLDTEEHPSSHALPPDTVTIARLAQCLPFIVLEFHHLGKAKLFFAKSRLGQGLENLSDVILCSLFNCVIPYSSKQHPVDKNPHFVCFLADVLMDGVINKKKEKLTDLDELFGYYAAGFHTEAVPPHARVHLLKHWGIANVTGDGVAELYCNKAGDAANQIRALRPEDPKLENVLKQIEELHN